MSQKNRQGKASAREQMRIDRERQERRAKQIKVFSVVGVVVVVIVAVVLGFVFIGGGSDKPVAAPKGAVGTGKQALPVGKSSAPTKLTIYEDFRCPACQAFEAQNDAGIQKLVKAGKVQVQYHIVQLIDQMGGGSGSKHAANAAACVYDELGSDQFMKLHNTLYKNQPDEHDDAYADNAKLLSLAKKAGVPQSSKLTSCVDKGSWNDWTDTVHKSFTAKYSGTPTVLVNGKETKNLNPGQLEKMLNGSK